MTERVTEFVSLAECSYQAPVGIQKANRDNRQRSRLPLRAHRWEDDLEWRGWLANATEDERLAELADFGALTPEQLEDWRRQAAAREAGEREQAALRARIREGARLVQAGEVEDLDEWLQGQEVEN